MTVWNILYSIGVLGLAAGLFGWVLWRWLKSSEEPLTLMVRWVLTAAVLVPLLLYALAARDPISQVAGILLAAVGGIILGIIWVPPLVEWVGDIFGSFYTGGKQEVEPQPFYSIADAKRKLGKYHEAITEVQKQLDLFPNDIPGWMRIAEIQADDIHDLTAAQTTIEIVLAQEGHAPKNIAYVLNRLTDWQLRYAKDIEAARASQERIQQLFPDTELAQLAAQRIAHLGTTQNLAEKTERAPIVLRPGQRNLGLLSPEQQQARAEDHAEAARKLVEHLALHPQDNEAREKLAVLYADHYQRLDLAAAELEQLIQTPNQQAKHVAHWLNLLADMQLRLGSDIAAAKQTLERIIEMFPSMAAAENARNRIAFLKMELRKNEKSQALKLGSYEKNLGLK